MSRLKKPSILNPIGDVSTQKTLGDMSTGNDPVISTGIQGWVTGRKYFVGDVVLKGYCTYVCVTEHSSGTFATDWYTNGKWAALGHAPGTVTEWAGANAPHGALICDNAAISRTTYDVLYAVIGTTFGAGDTSTTFNIPDHRGVFPKGAGTTDRAAGKDASGNYYAATLGAYLTDKSQGHRHLSPALGVSASNAQLLAALYVQNDGGSAQRIGSTSGSFAAYRYQTDDPRTDGTHNTPRTGLTTEPQSLGINFIIYY